MTLLYIVPFIQDPESGSTQKIAFAQCMEAGCCASVYGILLDMLVTLSMQLAGSLTLRSNEYQKLRYFKDK